MKKMLFVLFLLLFPKLKSISQNSSRDSLKNAIFKAGDDTATVNNLLQLAKTYISTSPEEAIRYSTDAKNLAQKLNYKTGKAAALKNIGMVYYNQTKYVETVEYWNHSYELFDSIGDKINAALLLSNLGSVYMNQGDDPKALEYYFKSLQVAEQIQDNHKIAIAMTNIGTIYSNNKFTYDKALAYYFKALPLSEKLNDQNVMGGVLVNIGEIYMNRNKDDSALNYFKKSLHAYKNTENIPYSLNDIGKIYTKQQHFVLAQQVHQEALSFAKKFNLQLDMAQSYLGLGNASYQSGNYKEALNAYENAKNTALKTNIKKELKDAYQGLTLTYARLLNFSNAYKYQTLFSAVKDTLLNLDLAQKIGNLETNFEIRRKQAQIDILTKDKEIKKLELKRQGITRNALIGGLILIFIITFIQWRNNRQKQRANFSLQRQKVKVESTLSELKATQSQLIQSEKMASLGELMAGIAHEIQNPLNFVNNFSEVNTELISEMQQELKTGHSDEAMHVSNNIKENQAKINHHGKRADAIVKNMLLHSRRSSAVKELTNINTLADEYLRLAYHGSRAGDKDFNVTMNTDYDERAGTISIIPQDIGRVLINLYSNAFYVVNEKKKLNPDGYVPAVVVSTKKIGERVEISVSDNGNGIPERILGKIFQPFFTTKPTGQGTGLGLSLAYDIIKAHGGEIKVETKEKEGTTFIIQLSVK